MTIFEQATEESINRAALIIKSGGLVAFPTETVYGLGANGLDGSAVAKIFAAKGRPNDNPLILHVYERSDVDNIAEEIPELAERLMEEFWPGPLTIVLKKKEHIPDEVSAGLSTVGVRMPSHEVARRLIKAAGVPIAAPSANSAGKPSPTRASHVRFDLDGKIDMILDGGGADLGLESTVIEVSGDTIEVLRPGAITVEMLRAVGGHVKIDPAIAMPEEGISPKAPGMKYKHYSPAAEVILIIGDAERVARYITQNSDEKSGILATDQTIDKYPRGSNVLSLGDREHPETIAANLFKMLRKCDYLGFERVYAEGFGDSELELAIMNRLTKACGYKIVYA